MIKAVLYIALAVLGMAGSLFSPLIGAITCIESYMMNPKAFAGNDWGFRYQLWTTIAFLIGLLIHQRGRLARVGRENAVMVWAWIFAGVCALSATWALVRPDVTLDFTWEMVKTLIASSALVWAIRSEFDISALMTAFAFGTLHAGVLHTVGARLGYIAPDLDRENGVLPEDQPTIMVMFLPLLIILAMKGSRLQKIIAWCAIPFALNSIVKSYQRAAFVGVIVVVLLLLLLLKGRTRVRLAAVLVVAGTLFVVRLAPPNYWDWVKSIEHPTEEASANSRFVVADASVRMYQDYPFGVGYKNYQFVSPRYLDEIYLTNGKRSAHNSFFAIACDLGPLGFIPWVFAVGTALVLFRRVRRSSYTGDPRLPMYALALEVGLVGWFAVGFFHDVHDADPAYWFLASSVILYRLCFRAGQTETEENAAAGSELVRTA